MPATIAKTAKNDKADRNDCISKPKPTKTPINIISKVRISTSTIVSPKYSAMLSPYVPVPTVVVVEPGPFNVALAEAPSPFAHNKSLTRDSNC